MSSKAFPIYFICALAVSIVRPPSRSSENANSIDKIINELKNTKVEERSGRQQDKETAYIMEKLRALGYM